MNPIQYVFGRAVHKFCCIYCGWLWSAVKMIAPWGTLPVYPTRCPMCGGQIRDLTAEVNQEDGNV